MGEQGTWRERMAAEDAEQERLRGLAQASAQRRAEAIAEGWASEFGGNAAAMAKELGMTRSAVGKLVARARTPR